MKITATFLLTFLFCYNLSYAQIPLAKDQIAATLQAAPEEKRDGAAVLGYNADGQLVTLKEGTNDLICLADDPNSSNFSAACYHKDLEPMMARGRALRMEGKNPAEVNDIRASEAKSGKMKMPDQPTTLHILSGNEGKYNPATGQVENAKLRYVVYIPYATSESTGLPESRTAPGHPWIMFPGTYRAHIMISPPGE